MNRGGRIFKPSGQPSCHSVFLTKAHVVGRHVTWGFHMG